MAATIPCLSTLSELGEALDTARGNGASVGLIPTMGALHDGHLSLIHRARLADDVVVVSIFVNPPQFGKGEDLEVYPRDLEGDLRRAEEAGADLVFNPAVDEMYPDGYSTWVDVEGLTSGLCGRSRPGHFRGVCTVVCKLFNICRPDRAYFGEKDAQQLLVIRRMARDLDTGVEIIPCPTVREPDGLAMSSRNTRLNRVQRAQAPVLYEALVVARDLVAAGERECAVLQRAIRSTIAKARLAKIDYVEIVDPGDLTPVATVAGECLVALAVRFGDVRLIDNMKVWG